MAFPGGRHMYPTPLTPGYGMPPTVPPPPAATNSEEVSSSQGRSKVYNLRIDAVVFLRSFLFHEFITTPKPNNS